jgi:Tetratricopeptide repeat
MQNTNSGRQRWPKLHYALATGCLLFLFWATWETASDGFSSSLSRGVPMDASGLDRLDRAIQLSPSDSRPYNLKARYFLNVGRMAEAERNFEFAIVRNPHGYLLWLSLGDTREQMGDPQGAVAAYQGAIRLAPSYAKPHWNLGMLWLRMGNREEGFSELRRGADADAELFPHLIHTAWEQYGGDARAVRHAVQPQSSSEYMKLADSFLAKHKASEAIDLYRAAGKLPQSERRTLIDKLLEAKAYTEAYEAWVEWRGAAAGGPMALTDGGFENDINRDALAFEWQASSKVEGLAVVRDKNKPEAGAYSLRVDFRGNSTPGSDIVSQTLMVEPIAKYALSFAGRTEQLVTGGLPVVVVADANNGEVLARSKPLTEDQIEWHNQSVEFSTRNGTQAVLITIKREMCSSWPCPAFGYVWFDSFTCKKL